MPEGRGGFTHVHTHTQIKIHTHEVPYLDVDKVMRPNGAWCWFLHQLEVTW